MLINNILNFIPQINNTRPIINSAGYSRISFGGLITNDTADLSFSRGLNKLKDFSIEEYNTLTEDELAALRREYDKKAHDLYVDMEDHEQISNCIKKYLDKTYGENKYNVITIGRSLSSFGKVLGYKIGEDNVVNIPMSDARQYLNEEHLKNLKNNGSIDTFKNFLETKGLTKEKIENSDKKYIIMDFCMKGGSLKGAKKLLTRDDLLGDKNIETLNVMDCIEDDESISDKDYFRDGFIYTEYKRFSFVKKGFTITSIPYSYVNTDKANTSIKLFWFKLLDNYMTNKI